MAPITTNPPDADARDKDNDFAKVSYDPAAWEYVQNGIDR